MIQEVARNPKTPPCPNCDGGAMSAIRDKEGNISEWGCQTCFVSILTERQRQ
jgi:hypothetical protein